MSWTGQGLVITGGTGFIGRAVRAARPDADAPPRSNVDLSDWPSTHAWFAHRRPRQVIHLAAMTGGVQFNRERSDDILEHNTRVDANVLRAAAASGAERVVALLASCAFHQPVDGPATEDDLHSGSPHPDARGTAVAKRRLDALCHDISATTGCRCSTLSPVTVFGPGDHIAPDRSHVVSALIWRALTTTRTGGTLSVWGTGQAVRQFLFVDDLVRLLLSALEEKSGADTTIVAPDAGMTIAELAARVTRAAGSDAPLAFTGDREGQRRKVLRSLHFHQRFPGATFTPFDSALARTVRWFETHGS